MQLTVNSELAGAADILPLPLAKPRSAWCALCAGRLLSTPRGVAVPDMLNIIYMEWNVTL